MSVVRDPAELARRIAAGERRALAQGITLVESQHPHDTARAQELLDLLSPTGSSTAVRVGLSGTPGVGKSTFIEALGKHLLVDPSVRLAVLAIDPSSPTTGGSILGDKTRMEFLSTHERAYVRPSPSSGALGGVAAKTREAMLLCEAAGCNVIVVETVGVGQSEHAVSSITDTFVLLLAPAGGDDLQGQKRGVLDLVDVVVVNKADGPLLPVAEETASHYKLAGHLLHGHHAWDPPVLLASAATSTGIDDVWRAVLRHRAFLGDTLGARRAAQAERWFLACFEAELLARAKGSSTLSPHLARALADVRAGRVSPGRAAAVVVDALLGGGG